MNKNKISIVFLSLTALIILVWVIDKNKLDLIEQQANVVVTQNNGLPYTPLVKIPEGNIIRTFYGSGEIIPESVIVNPNVDGIMLARYMDELNPTPGNYNWSIIDSEMMRYQNLRPSEMKDLFVKFDFAGGERLPEWLFNQMGAYNAQTNPTGYLTFVEYRKNGACQFTNYPPGDATGTGGSKAITFRVPNYKNVVFQNYITNFANDLKNHLVNSQFPDGSTYYSHVYGINFLTLARDTGELRPGGDQQLVQACNRGGTSTNGPALWASAGYKPTVGNDSVMSVLNNLMDVWYNTFPDISINLQIVPNSFPKINDQGIVDANLADFVGTVLVPNSIERYFKNSAKPHITLEWNAFSQSTLGGNSTIQNAKLNNPKLPIGYQLEETDFGHLPCTTNCSAIIKNNFAMSLNAIANLGALWVVAYPDNSMQFPNEMHTSHLALNTPPTAPSNLTETHTKNTIVLNWSASTDNSGNVAYEIYDGDHLLGFANQPTVTLNNVLPGTTYMLTVVGRDSMGNVSLPSNAVTIQIANGGFKPSVPYVTSNVGANSVVLNWTPSTVLGGNIEKYIVNRNGVQLAIVEGNVNTYTDNSVVGGETYTYSIRSKVNKKVSYPSKDIVVEIESNDFTAPSTPAGLTINNITNNSATLSWNASQDNTTVANYLIYKNSKYLATTTNTSYNISGLNAGTAYGFKVVAKDSNNNVSGESVTKSMVTAGGSLNVNVTPSTPTGLHYNVEGTNVTISWDPSSNAYKYRVLQNQNYIGQTIAPETSYTIQSSHGASFSIKVIAKNADGAEGLSGLGAEIMVNVP